jgi:hypothetical protein
MATKYLKLSHDLLFPHRFQIIIHSNHHTRVSVRELELLFEWLFAANQFILATSPLRLTTSIFFQLNTCDNNPYVISSLMRGWVCRLQLLLALASAVILGFESRGTHDHILLSQI